MQEYGSRFRAISPYVQDNWKVTPKLTSTSGFRYDFFPTLREAHDNMSFFNPNLTNPVTGVNGALQFAGTGANTCNCHTPSTTTTRTSARASASPIRSIRRRSSAPATASCTPTATAVGGGNGTAGQAGNTLGFSASPNFSANAQLLGGLP